jgi:hypothetical protein
VSPPPGPLRKANDNGGGCAAADLVEPAKDTGPPLGPQGCFASRYARRAYRRALDPRASATPQAGNAGRLSLPHPVRGLHKISHTFDITTTEVSTVRGD